MERSGPTLAAFHRASWLGWSGTRGAPADATERLSCWTASRYICALARVCICVVLECAPTQCVPSISQRLAGWRGASGEIGTGASLHGSCSRVIYSYASLNFTGICSAKYFNQFLESKLQDFRNFVLHTCIVIFDDEQVYLTLRDKFKSPISRLRKEQRTPDPKP